MNQSELLRRTMLRSLLVCALLALSGCALIPLEPPPPAPPASPEPAPEPPPPVEEAPAVDPAPLADDPPVPQAVSARVAVVLSDSLPAYTNVAQELASWLEDYSVHDLADRKRSPRQVFAAIADSQAVSVVAVGLKAARLAKAYATVPVIFSQVFNVGENDLVSESTRGVASLPPLDLQVQAWREMDPKIRNIGAILGAGHDELIAEANEAMSKRDLDFHHAIAESDRETIYHFKRLVRDIDGYLLFPDNRILSRAAFSEIMKEAARHHVQVAVFNDSLLVHGATFSASAVNSDIAAKITLALNAIENGNFDGVSPVTPLSKIRVRTNPEMVRIFGLIVDDASDNSVADAQ